jgi:thymidylate kinase
LLIIFLGPQGSGKTTQAILLKRKLKMLGYRVTVTESVHYTILLRMWHKLLMFLTRRRIRYRFRREGLVEEFVEPSLLARTFRVDFVVNLVSAVISSLKISLLSLLYPVVIEHEGFVYNQLAYLCFIYRKLFAMKFLMRSYQILLRLPPRKRLVIVLDVSNLKPGELYARYRRRGGLSEPWHYIRYQMVIYRVLASMEQRHALFDASMNMIELSNDIYTFIFQNLK